MIALDKGLTEHCGVSTINLALKGCSGSLDIL